MANVVLNDYSVVIKEQATDGGLYTLSSPTELLPQAQDDAWSTNKSIGFDFPFNSTDYSHFYVNSNGFLGLNTSSSGSQLTVASHSDIRFNVNSSYIILAPWWDDLRLVPTVGHVDYEYQASENRLVVEWNIYLHYSMSATHNRNAKMQAVLKSNGDIEFRYGTRQITGSFNIATSATVGIKSDTSAGTPNNVRDFTWFMASGTSSDSPKGSTIGSQIVLQDSGSFISDWPGDDFNEGPVDEKYNIHFLRPETIGNTYSGDIIDGDYTLNKNLSISSQYDQRPSKYYISASAANPEQVPFSKMVSGPASLRKRSKPYLVSSGGNPEDIPT